MRALPLDSRDREPPRVLFFLMLFNHRRERVHEHSAGESLCPLCEGPLIARRGEQVIWHWAHRPRTRTIVQACPFEESAWHLACKDAYTRLSGWIVEHPVTVHGQRYILDAVNPRTRRVREFVHTLSPYYVSKHLTLLQRYPDVRWLFDGAAFASLRAVRCRDGEGIKHLLKPRALAAAELLLPCVGVHYKGHIMRHWCANIWYPIHSERATYVLTELGQALNERMPISADCMQSSC